MDLPERLRFDPCHLIAFDVVAIDEREIRSTEEDCVPESERMHGEYIILCDRSSDGHDIPRRLIEQTHVDVRLIRFSHAKLCRDLVPPRIVLRLRQARRRMDVHVDLTDFSIGRENPTIEQRLRDEVREIGDALRTPLTSEVHDAERMILHLDVRESRPDVAEEPFTVRQNLVDDLHRFFFRRQESGRVIPCFSDQLTCQFDAVILCDDGQLPPVLLDARDRPVHDGRELRSSGAVPHP